METLAAYEYVMDKAREINAVIEPMKDQTPYEKGCNLPIEKWVLIKIPVENHYSIMEAISVFSKLGITFETSSDGKFFDWLIDWSFSSNDNSSEEWEDANNMYYNDDDDEAWKCNI